MEYENEYDNYSYLYEDIEKYAPTRLVPSRSAYILVLVIYFITFSIGISLNGIVIWLTGFKWRRSITTYLFLNLAVADFMLVLFLPLEIIYLLINFHWPFGSLMCKVSSFVFHTSAYSSVFLLMLISIDRYCCSFLIDICHVYRFQNIVTVVTYILWIISMVLSLPHYYFKSIRQTGNDINDCLDDFHKDNKMFITIRNTLSGISFVIGYLFPGTVMVFCYYNLAVNNRRLPKGHFYAILLLITAFFICWTPYNSLKFSNIIIQNSFYNDSNIIDIHLISTSITFLNSCINPIIYVFLSKLLRLDRVSITDSLRLVLSEEIKNGSNNSV
ncbi:MPPV-042 G protein-coupled receptor-like protein [Magpiepox virus 2]|nr:MPPV-042 G protein-coupled receptor-like protein [Magpiepox virus 2]